MKLRISFLEEANEQTFCIFCDEKFLTLNAETIRSMALSCEFGATISGSIQDTIILFSSRETAVDFLHTLLWEKIL